MQRQTRLELEMGGKVRPLLFDFTFLDFLMEVISFNDLDALAATKPWRMIPPIALAALQSGADFEAKKDKFDLKTVTGWVEQMDGLDANNILEAYKTAMGFINKALSGKEAEKTEAQPPSTGIAT